MNNLTEKEKQMLDCVSRCSDVPAEDIIGKRGKLRMYYARMAFALLLYKSGLSMYDIGAKLSGRHHSSISVMLRGTSWAYDHDDVFTGIVDRVREEYDISVYSAPAVNGRRLKPNRVLKKRHGAQAA